MSYLKHRHNLELFARSDEGRYGFDFDRPEGSQFRTDMGEFMDRLREYRTRSKEDWFIKSLKQKEFYEEKYEELVKLMKQYSWVGKAPELLDPNLAKLLQITPRDAWNGFISTFCVIDENQNIELLSIFDLLNPTTGTFRDPEYRSP